MWQTPAAAVAVAVFLVATNCHICAFSMDSRVQTAIATATATSLLANMENENRKNALSFECIACVATLLKLHKAPALYYKYSHSFSLFLLFFFTDFLNKY